MITDCLSDLIQLRRSIRALVVTRHADHAAEPRAKLVAFRCAKGVCGFALHRRFVDSVLCGKLRIS